MDEAGHATALAADVGFYNIQVPGATCTQISECLVGGAPRLLVETGAPAGRAALGAVEPAILAVTATAVVSPTVADQPSPRPPATAWPSATVRPLPTPTPASTPTVTPMPTLSAKASLPTALSALSSFANFAGDFGSIHDHDFRDRHPNAGTLQRAGHRLAAPRPRRASRRAFAAGRSAALMATPHPTLPAATGARPVMLAERPTWAATGPIWAAMLVVLGLAAFVLRRRR